MTTWPDCTIGPRPLLVALVFVEPASVSLAAATTAAGAATADEVNKGPPRANRQARARGDRRRIGQDQRTGSDDGAAGIAIGAAENTVPGLSMVSEPRR